VQPQEKLRHRQKPTTVFPFIIAAMAGTNLPSAPANGEIGKRFTIMTNQSIAGI
jgi:hypothetical protein